MVHQAVKSRLIPGAGRFNQFDDPFLARCWLLLIGRVRILHAALLADLPCACPCQCAIHSGTRPLKGLAVDHFCIITGCWDGDGDFADRLVFTITGHPSEGPDFVDALSTGFVYAITVMPLFFLPMDSSGNLVNPIGGWGVF